MSSLTPGASISAAEITVITDLGFWLLVDDREFFVPFADYPDFLQATIEQIYQFEAPSPTQFYWPALDVDIDLNALEDPQRFPLVFRR